MNYKKDKFDYYVDKDGDIWMVDINTKDVYLDRIVTDSGQGIEKYDFKEDDINNYWPDKVRDYRIKPITQKEAFLMML